MTTNEVTRSSEKAWRFTMDGKAAELRNSLARLFVNELVGPVETSQRGLPDFVANMGGDS